MSSRDRLIFRPSLCHSGKRYYAKGLCSSCYQKQWEKNNPKAAQAIQQREYRKNHDRYITRAKVYYQANAEAIRKRSRAWSAAHPDIRLNTRRQRDYGITSEDYRNYLVGQAGRCLICLRVPERNLTVDHDHSTGKVRGLLCHHCNRALGHLRDNPDAARRAAGYLERFGA